jgi:hypothetical protein
LPRALDGRGLVQRLGEWRLGLPFHTL